MAIVAPVIEHCPPKQDDITQQQLMKTEQSETPPLNGQQESCQEELNSGVFSPRSSLLYISTCK